MFAGVPGPIFGIPIWQTYLANISGGIVSATLFYVAAELVIKWTHNRRVKKNQDRIAKGENPVVKQKFTRTNKLLIKVKNSAGIYGVAFLAPLFLSIPVGTVITAKFYGKRKGTLFIIYLGICVNGCLTTGIPYLL